MIVKKLISVFLIFALFLHLSLPLFAQEATPTPDPEATSEAVLEVHETYEATNSATAVFGPDATSEGAIVNSGDASDITVTDTSVKTVNINNDNNFDGQINASDSAITGDNTADKNISLSGAIEVKTGPAAIIQNLQNIINTNIVGSNAIVSLLNIFENTGGNIDLSGVLPCQQNGQIIAPDVPLIANSGNNVTVLTEDSDKTFFKVNNDNDATVTNNVDATAVTGNNEAIENIAAGTHVETGPAQINTNLFNMVNTNLVGNCFYFGVINLFGQFNGDIILPYEIDFLRGSGRIHSQSEIVNTGDNLNATESATIQNILAAKNTNSAVVSTVINTDANTGRNNLSDTINFTDGGFIETGSSNVFTNVLDVMNTNIVGGRFVIIQINRLSEWVGSVVGTLETYIVEPKYLLLYQKGEQSANTGEDVSIVSQKELLNMLSVTNDNVATVENTLNLTSNTGDNTAGRFNASIKSGNSDIRANVFDLVNTNIVGNNWMYVMINVFDKFTGNVVLSRADISITKSTTAHEVQHGDVITYKIHVENNGQVAADFVGIEDVLPSSEELVSATFSPELTGSTMTWRLGTIPSKQSRDIFVNVRIKDNIDGTPIVNQATAYTSTAEFAVNNNSSSSTIYYKNRPTSGGGQSTSSSSQGGSSSSGGSSQNVNNNFYQAPLVLGKAYKKAVKKLVTKKNTKKKFKKTKSPIKSIKKPAKKLSKLRSLFSIFRR